MKEGLPRLGNWGFLWAVFGVVGVVVLTLHTVMLYHPFDEASSALKDQETLTLPPLNLEECIKVLRTQEKDGEPPLSEPLMREMCRQFHSHATRVAGVYTEAGYPSSQELNQPLYRQQAL